MSELLFPAQWRRQNPYPLDASDSYATYAAMQSYTESVTAYAGQILYCAETDKLYYVKSDMSLEPMGVSYTDPNGTTADVGGWAKGDTAANMAIQDALYKLLHKYVEPVIVLTATPSNTSVEIGTTIPTSTFVASITRGSNSITTVEFLVNDVVVKTYSSGVSEGGTFTYTRNTAISNDSTVAVRVTDDSTNNPVVSSVQYVFQYASFSGVVNTPNPSTQVISLLTKDLLGSHDKTVTGISMTNQYFCYTYPSEYGQLTKISDGNGFDVTDEFIRTDIVDLYGNHPFFCYTSKDTASLSNGSFKFE